MTVLAATAWATNADMIVDCVALGYIKPDDRVIDLTFGRGKWWTKYDHTQLGPFTAVFQALTEDMDGAITDYGTTTSYHGDFRSLPAEWAERFDVVTFDPPYIAMGGRDTSNLPDFMDRYGLEEAAVTPAALHEHNVEGLAEAFRVCKPGGFVMTKCAPYISSGRLQLGDHWMLEAGIELGFKVHDRLIHVGHVRPQPGGRTVKHARNNYSVLWVFQKPKTRKKT